MAYKITKALTPYCFPKQLRSYKHGQQDMNVLKVRLTQNQRWQTTLLEQKTHSVTPYIHQLAQYYNKQTSNRSKRQRAPSSGMPGHL